MKYYLFIAVSFFSAISVEAKVHSSKAQPKEARDVEKAKARIERVQSDIAELKTSITAIDQKQAELNQQLESSEQSFKEHFSKVLVPLLNWPAVSTSMSLPSWIEQEHLKLLLVAVRDRVVREPLELISERELRLHDSESMKTDFAVALKQLESKEAILDAELDALRSIHEKSDKAQKKMATQKARVPELE